jgi:SAM-dependent methyltransferase
MMAGDAKPTAAETLQQIYAGSSDLVRARFTSLTEAERYYQRFVDFVVQSVGVPASGRQLLDIGCGEGWTTRIFQRMGFDSVGLDLNAESFFHTDEGVRFVAGSATHLPFRDQSFDIVVMYQALEHVPAPEQALDEIVRVTKSNGTVCVVSPNLVSVLHSLRSLWRSVRTMTIRRTPGLPRHPFGNTVPESVASILMTTTMTIRKSFSSEPCFTMRKPDLTPPFYADNDAVYLCNPLDLDRYFHEKRWMLRRRGAPGRPPWLAPILGGTWIAASPESVVTDTGSAPLGVAVHG